MDKMVLDDNKRIIHKNIWRNIENDHLIKTSLTFKCLIEHLFADFSYSQLLIHVNPPGSSGSLPEMPPDSRTPGSETEPPRCENTKNKQIQ